MKRWNREPTEVLLDLMKIKKSKDYNLGLIQAAVSFGVIDHRTWEKLFREINKNASTDKL